MRPYARPVYSIPLEEELEESDQRAAAPQTPGVSPAGTSTPPPGAE